MKSGTLFAVTLTLLAASLVTAQDPFAGYSCDPAVCKLPTCRCASLSPPVANPPQFVIVTFDDSIQQATYPQTMSFVTGRKNPNGCPVGTTFFAQSWYSDPILATNYYYNSQEIAVHSIDHLAPAPSVNFYSETEGFRYWATRFAGISRDKLQGYRHPFLNYTQESIELLAAMGFLYDSSMSSDIKDDVWPYTLDYGAVNDCANPTNTQICNRKLNAAGLWEIPIAGISDSAGLSYGLDAYNFPTLANPFPPATLQAMYKASFDRRYAGTRTPFGVYTHPVWLGAAQPSIPDGAAKLAALKASVDYAMSHPDVWMVTNAQLIEYMKNPVPASQLAAQPYMQCSGVVPPTNICNGNNITMAQTCNLVTGTIHTCYGCPDKVQDVATGKITVNFAEGGPCPVPDTCDTKWWDPAGCKCLCTDASCARIDKSRPIQPDGLPGAPAGNLGAGSSGSSPTGAKSAAGSISPQVSFGAFIALMTVLYFDFI